MFAALEWMVFAFAAVCALAGNLAFFYMQRRIEENGYRPKFLKSISDLRDVYSYYQRMSDLREVPLWPRVVWVVSLSGMVVCICSLIIVAVLYRGR
jgi:hypothetical protein